MTHIRRFGVLLAISVGAFAQSIDTNGRRDTVVTDNTTTTCSSTNLPAASGYTGKTVNVVNTAQTTVVACRSNGSAWVTVSGSSSGGSGTPSFNVTTTGTVITMAPGTVGTAAAGYSALTGTYTITKSSGTDTGTFSVGVSDSNTPVCYYGSGITIGNWTVAGFTGSTCTSGTAPTNYYLVSISVAAGVVGSAPTQYQPVTLQKLTANAGLVCTPGACGVDDTVIVQKFFGSGAPTTVTGSVQGDLYFNTASSYAPYVCADSQCATGTPTWNAITSGGGSSPNICFNAAGSAGAISIVSGNTTFTSCSITGGTLTTGHCLDVHGMVQIVSGSSSPQFSLNYGTATVNILNTGVSNNAISFQGSVCDTGTSAQQLQIWWAMDASNNLAAAITLPTTGSVNSATTQTLSVVLNNGGTATGTLFAFEVSLN